MSMRDIALSAALAIALSGAALAEGPNLGKPISQEDIAPWDISIGPDGAGLPPGSGTVKQGEAVFMAKCQGCHGENGGGGPNDRLVGRSGRLPATSRPSRRSAATGLMRQLCSIMCAGRCRFRNRSPDQ